MAANQAAIIVEPAHMPAIQPQITPMQMLNMAVQQGADVEKMAQLLALQERWEANEARKAFVAALNAFKADAPQIIKTREVSFGAGKTAYKHAIAGVASEQIGEALAKVGISHRWDVLQSDGGKIKVTCILTHALGHSERVAMEATADSSGSKNSIQAIGSTVSYLQRYTLFASTGLVPKDADDDGKGGGTGHAMEPKTRDEFAFAIDASTDKKKLEALWQQIATKCTKVGDVEAYAELKALVAKKLKALA
jgi:hypothetical protein